MSERLNVLLVVLDCARADHLSCFGYDRETTPFLDQIAREGVRFLNTIATAPWTLPSHAALFTGLHSVTHGASDENRFLSARHMLLPEYLKAAGYRTAAFCTNPWVSPETGFGRGFDVFFTQRFPNRLAARALRLGRTASDRLLRRRDCGARRTNQALQHWLAASDQPFFAFVHYDEPRLRVHLPRLYQSMFLPDDVTDAGVTDVTPGTDGCPGGPAQTSAEDGTILRALYDGALRYVDSCLHDIAQSLRARNDWDRTVLIVMGDHGESLGEHGVIGHNLALYDTLLHVPLLFRCPLRVPQGFAVEELAQPTDVLPTLLEMLGIAEDSAPLQGRPLLAAGRVTPGPSFTISEAFRPDLSALRRDFPTFDTRPFEVRKKAIRTRREKFVWHSDEANEFYDLIADPAEQHNLFDQEGGRSDALRGQLFSWLAEVKKYEHEDPVSERNPDQRRQVHGAGSMD